MRSVQKDDKERELKEIVPIAVRQLLFDRELKKHFCVYFVWNHLKEEKV